MDDDRPSPWRRWLVEAAIVLGWVAMGAAFGYSAGPIVGPWLGDWSGMATTVAGIVIGGIAGPLHLVLRRWPRVQREVREAEVRRHEAFQDALDIAVADANTNRPKEVDED